MDNRRQIALLFVLTLMLLILASCNTHQAQYPRLPASLEPTITLSPIPTSLPIPTAPQEPTITSSPIPTSLPLPSATQETPPYLVPTHWPTLLPEQEQRMVDLLHLSDCELPCYLGIMPGKTSWEKTEEILKTIGAIYPGEHHDKDFSHYSYDIVVGDPNSPTITPSPNFEVSRNIEFTNIRYGLGFTIADDIVQQMDVWVDAGKMAEKFHKYWSRYSLAELLRVKGVPDLVFTWRFDSGGLGYGMFIIYEKLGVGFDYLGIKRGKLICPLVQEEAQTSFSMVLTNTSVIPEIEPPGSVLLSEREVYLPIKETLGIDETEFYNRLHGDPTACFEIIEAK